MPYRLLIIFVFCCFTNTLFSQSDWNAITVVGNKTELKSISKSKLKRIFKGYESRWNNDNEIIVVLHSSKSPTCEIMAQTIFGSSMKTVKRYWLNLVFQGRANPPVFLDDNLEILNYVKSHPGAIGILVNYSGATEYQINLE
jgi:ABC-type phosphate transport system substrate-binding protein